MQGGGDQGQEPQARSRLLLESAADDGQGVAPPQTPSRAAGSLCTEQDEQRRESTLLRPFLGTTLPTEEQAWTPPDPPPRGRCWGGPRPQRPRELQASSVGLRAQTGPPGRYGPRSPRPASQLHLGPCSRERAGDEEANSSVTESPWGLGEPGAQDTGPGLFQIRGWGGTQGTELSINAKRSQQSALSDRTAFHSLKGPFLSLGRKDRGGDAGGGTCEGPWVHLPPRIANKIGGLTSVRPSADYSQNCGPQTVLGQRRLSAGSQRACKNLSPPVCTRCLGQVPSGESTLPSSTYGGLGWATHPLHTHAHTHRCAHTRAHRPTLTCMHAHVCAHAHMCTHVYTETHSHARVHICTHTHVHVHTCTHTHKHSHINTLSLTPTHIPSVPTSLSLKGKQRRSHQTHKLPPPGEGSHGMLPPEPWRHSAWAEDRPTLLGKWAGGRRCLQAHSSLGTAAIPQEPS